MPSHVSLGLEVVAAGIPFYSPTPQVPACSTTVQTLRYNASPAVVLPRKDAKVSNRRTESPKEMYKIDNTPKIHTNLSRKENRR